MLSSGTLTPAFASATTSYTASVANSVASITVTPTEADTTATTTVNGIAVNSGTASGAIALQSVNTINTVVTAQDGTTIKTYTVVVTRATPPLSTNANLSNLVLSAGTLSPAFASATISYTASVANSVASITVTPTEADTTATTTVNGIAVNSGTASGAIALAVGNNTIDTVVTAQDGTTTKTYTVVVNRATSSLSTNANLSSLVLSAGTLSPAFASATISYTASVANSVTSITVTPTEADTTATTTVNGTAVNSGTPSGAIALVVGNNTITTVVTAQDTTTTKTYTVVVNRAAVNSTTAGALTFGGVTGDTIIVTAPFTGDSNGNNSCIIRWGTVNGGPYPNIATSTKSGNAYVATVSGLSESTTYYFQATFTDAADGVTGSPVTGSKATTALISPLMHSSANPAIGTTKHGTWGTTFTCATCHQPLSTNVKMVATQVQTPNGLRPVVFTE